jgi:holo-[acyl-carrier protein] synthase
MILGLGTDIVEVSRISELWAESREGFARRVFTDAEIAYCSGRAHPAQNLAARFAAKEAALKAIGTGWAKGLGLRDVEVIRHESGMPTLHFHGKAAEAVLRMGVTHAFLTLSHTDQHASATVILEAAPTARHPGQTAPVISIPTVALPPQPETHDDAAAPGIHHMDF